MILNCYYCNKDLPSNWMKRCARCLLVTYCSKECQTLSWKAGHKINCKINTWSGMVSEPPKKFTPEWVEAQVDRELTRWLQIWRSFFMTWTTIALDLANHPADRVMTHCMQLIIQPRQLEDNSTKQYQVIDAAIVLLSDVQTTYPNLEVAVDPNDFTRMRFLVILQNDGGVKSRLRLIQWNDLNVFQWRKMSKTESAAIGGPESEWKQTLMFAVDEMDPKEIEKMQCRKKYSHSLTPKELSEMLERSRSVADSGMRQLESELSLAKIS